MLGILESGIRKVLAAILLIVPGILTDVMALLLLLLPINHARLRPQPQPAGAGRGYGHAKSIEGEFRRTD